MNDSPLGGWLPGSGGNPSPVHPETLRLLESSAESRLCKIGFRIYEPGDPTGYWYTLLLGAAKRHAFTPEGRQQIVDFLLPDDWFGPSTRVAHEFTAEVLASGTLVARYPYVHLRKVMEAHPRSMLRLLDTVLQSTSRVERHVQLLGHTDARVRVGGFLLDMAARCKAGSGVFALPMSRYDIADYLVLSVETVSRALTHWRTNGAIELSNRRQVRILKPDALELTTRGRD